ncbi:serine hydrolase domain-containing protein [Actinopolymorpha pittospori]|uniref:CubicO group peptidase (Beta-lactamase class C family) n=1 Tax=Actinopolymorpha pittospori TaxID=648752 RepID=A0A927MX84_9ACTN|nr:serine hydrolase domain-containing protein [Actinopolymorpha pittospori]MBE1604977.1 CubicO group peptidase (beta-lactamase class C family) [Actinopolymorpha pittospori]
MRMIDAERTLAELRRGQRLGWHTGAQVHAWVDGEEVVGLATGQARPGRPMSPATIVEWASATKPVTCTALMLLVDRGSLGLDDPVCFHLPEFGTAGKEAVTVRHLLTHTAGLTSTITGVAPPEQVIADICAAPLREGWEPGRRCAYNSVAMWIVAALVARLSGRRFVDFVRSEVFAPAGIRESWIGMPATEYAARRDDLAVIPGSPTSGTRDWVTWERPTGGGHGPIRDLGLFYAAFLAGRLCPPALVAAMTRRELAGVYDEYVDATVDRGLGFLLGSSYAGHSYGPHASGHSFGHGGRNWCVAFADPKVGLAAAVYWNGQVDPGTQAVRQPATLAALYEDLGLA